MTASARRSGGRLYTPEILALAVELAQYQLDDAESERGTAVSRVCGSRVVIGLDASPDGAIERIGAQATACAIGQAAAALFLRSAIGKRREDIAHAASALEEWLSADGPIPPWPGLAVLTPARAYPARHPAILLPWKAALDALSKSDSAG